MKCWAIIIEVELNKLRVLRRRIFSNVISVISRSHKSWCWLRRCTQEGRSKSGAACKHVLNSAWQPSIVPLSNTWKFQTQCLYSAMHLYSSSSNYPKTSSYSSAFSSFCTFKFYKATPVAATMATTDGITTLETFTT